MKKFVLACICLISACICQAQVLQEWLNQNKTQIKYLVEQIAAFETYVGYVRKGYNIADNGLSSIRDLKRGELTLHSDHFNSLKHVSSVISQSGRVADIIAMQTYIVKVSTSALKTARTNQETFPEELDYLEQVYAQILKESQIDIDQLSQLVTDNRLEMKDDERIIRIDGLYNTIRDKYMFLRSFSGGVSILMLQRYKAQLQVDNERRILGVK